MKCEWQWNHLGEHLGGRGVMRSGGQRIWFMGSCRSEPGAGRCWMGMSHRTCRSAGDQGGSGWGSGCEGRQDQEYRWEKTLCVVVTSGKGPSPHTRTLCTQRLDLEQGTPRG